MFRIQRIWILSTVFEPIDTLKLFKLRLNKLAIKKKKPRSPLVISNPPFNQILLRTQILKKEKNNTLEI